MDVKYMYDFIKNNNPNTLGSLIIDYVEKLKADNKAMKQKLTLTDVVKRYRVEAISFNKKHLHNVVVESIEEAEKLYQDLKIKYYQTYTNITMTEL